jgi:hypothetical protein
MSAGEKIFNTTAGSEELNELGKKQIPHHIGTVRRSSVFESHFEYGIEAEIQ